MSLEIIFFFTVASCSTRFRPQLTLNSSFPKFITVAQQDLNKVYFEIDQIKDLAHFPLFQKELLYMFFT